MNTIDANTGEVLKANIPLPSSEVLLTPATSLLAGVEGLVIDCEEVYTASAADVKYAKDSIKSLEEDRMGLTRPLDELKRKIMDKYRPATDAYQRFIDTVRRVGLEPFKAAANAARRPAETETA